MELTTTHIIAGTYTLVGLLLAAALFQVLFILADVRKIVRRFTTVSEHVEATVIRPLSMAEQAFSWVQTYLEHHQARSEKHAKHQAKKRQHAADDDEEDEA
jgi:hypothetical protein